VYSSVIIVVLPIYHPWIELKFSSIITSKSFDSVVSTFWKPDIYEEN
jgi:hypothetical protein